jgi:PDZ domain-containing protein
VDAPEPAPQFASLPAPPAPTEAQRKRVRRRRRLAASGWIALILSVVVVWAGQFVRISYYTEAPGDAVAVQPMVAIDGAPEFESAGSFMLLYIRRADHITLWRYVQARLDGDMDVKKGDYSQPGNSKADRDALSVSDMTSAQIAAKKLALERIGESITVLDGVVVTSVIGNRPAADHLRPGDVVLEVDGVAIGPGEGALLAETIVAHTPGEQVSITFERDGKRQTADIETESDGNTPARAIIGVLVDARYEYPIDIEFEGEIERIGGPSAGLAMTLALIDELTPGELSGGGDVAVTGTIDIDGNVGNVGRVDLKAKAAARRGVTLMLVPTCHPTADPDAYESREVYAMALDFERSCAAEVRRADAAIDTVVEVATLDEALSALAEHGGEPLPVEFSGATTTTQA